jgi:hypothetical protein
MVTQNGGKKETNDYATLTTSTRLENDEVVLHDTITLAPAYDDNGTVFERTMEFPDNNLLRPDQIMQDNVGGGRSVREMSYGNGEMKILNYSGATDVEHPKFDNGILTFNTLLRLAPLLPRDPGRVYTFQMYGEPFRFLIREAAKNAPFTITCEAVEAVKIGEKSFKCVKFRMELKSAQIRTDVWVGDNNLVVKWADMSLAETEPYCLEATLQE